MFVCNGFCTNVFATRGQKNYAPLPCAVIKIAPLIKRYQRSTFENVQRRQIYNGAK